MALQTVLDDIRKRPGSGDVITVIDPATEETITEFTDCGADAVDEALCRPRGPSSPAFGQLPGRERAKVMWHIADLIDEHAQEFAELDSPTPACHCYRQRCRCRRVRSFSAITPARVRRSTASPTTSRPRASRSDAYVNMHAYTLKEPYGVVGLIFPWNGPIFNASAKLAPALAAGGSLLVNALRKPHFRPCCSTS